MLLEDIQKSISDMDELKQLEQAARDSQKQENADKLFTAAVNDNHNIVISLNEARNYLSFKPSEELKRQIKNMFAALQECISAGLVQESKAKALSSTIKALKDSINEEWKTFYAGIADGRIIKLTTVQSITPDKTKTGYVLTKIKNGAKLHYGDDGNLRLFAAGIKEADDILESLELTDEILRFLDKVSEGRATIMDLTEAVEIWIREEQLSMKFSICFEA